MKPAFTIRIATGADALRIGRMSRDLIERGLPWSWTPSRVRHSIADAETNVVVASVRGAVVGFAIMKYHDDEAHLLLLAVQQASKRQGIGAALVAWLEACARTAGVGQAYLEARAVNGGARAFYRRLGYEEIQVVPGYYQGREASVRMAKDLWIEQAASA